MIIPVLGLVAVLSPMLAGGSLRRLGDLRIRGTWIVALALVALGCDRIQGYHVSRPLTADALEAWLAARRAVSSDIVAMVGGEAS